MLAGIKQDEWDWVGAERGHKRAVELNANLAEARHRYARYLSVMGRYPEALAEVKRAQELDPLRVSLRLREGIVLYLAQGYDEAIERLRSVIELEPDYGLAHHILGVTYEAKGMYEQAINEYQKAISIEREMTEAQILLGYALAKSGRKSEARAVLDKLKSTKEYVSPAILAILYIGLGDMEEAIAALERAYAAHDLHRSFERMAGWFEIDHTLTEGDEPMRLTCVWVTADFFPLLGTSPMLGRFFEPAEFKTTQPQAVIVSHALWRDRFGATHDLPGKNISINEKSYTVVGVMPPGFQFPAQPDAIEVWMPNPEIASGPYGARDVRLLNVAGRLKPKVTPRQAQAEMEVITVALRAEHPKTNQYTGARLIPAVEELTRGFRRPLLVLFGAVGCVLLIACVNVAGLLLARGASRQREMAVRSALGGSRRRIIRQLLTESLILACVGGGLGALLAAWGLDALVALSPTELPGRAAIGLDGRVLAFTLSLSLLTGMLFGLAPAWSASKIDLTTSLKDGVRGATDSPAGRRLRGALVVAEIALALVLLAGAGLLVKSFWRLRQVDPGFDPRNVLTLWLSLDGYKYQKPAEWAEWFRSLQKRLQTIPGVLQASVVMPTPMHGVPMFHDFVFPFEIEGRLPEKGENARISGYTIQPGYFRTMGIRLVAGRDFSARDDSGAPAVIIISEELARRYFPNENPLGKRMRMIGPFAGPNPCWREIVGVAGDVKGSRLNAAAKPEVYTAHTQDPFNEMYVALKTSVDPHSVVNAVRAEVQSLHKYQAFYDVKTLAERLDASVAQQRFSMLLLTIFAALALILTAVGLYGVMAYTVAQWTHEIGIRMALGAQTGAVLKLVVMQGMTLALIGVVIGLIASFALTRLISSLLFGVAATDPATFIVIASLLLAVALLACWIPARRATKVDPMVALRYE